MMAGHCSAPRRRERQLRAWHRHVKMTAAMELATAFHHSAQPARPVVEEPREVEAQDTNPALRGQKDSSTGSAASTSLSEVARPQRSDRTVRRSS